MTAPVAAVSYGLAAVAFGGLALVLVMGQRQLGRGALLVLVAACTALWAGCMAITGGRAGTPFTHWAIFAAEWVRLLAWLVFLAAVLCVGDFASRIVPRNAAVWTATVAAVSGAVGTGLLGMGMAPTLGYAALLVATLIPLVLTEQLYRRTLGDHRWALKHLCLGVGIVFVLDAYIYAEALLLGGLSGPLWEVRGVVNALAVPLVAVSTARNPRWTVDLGLSRRLVTDSLTVAAAGMFLLLMAGVAYYLRYVGGTWSSLLQLTFLFAAAIAVTVAFFSGSVRAGMRVLVAKHFFAYRYDYRDEWLRLVATLARVDGELAVRARAIRALADVVESPAGALFTATEAGNFTLGATWNRTLTSTHTEREDAPLPRFLFERDWIIDITECRDHPERYEGLILPQWLTAFPDAWLVVPLRRAEQLQGFVVLARPRVPQRLGWEERDLLKTAGRQVALYVALLDANDVLIANRQFDAFNRLSAYLVHDLKNVSGQLALITHNAMRLQTNPEFVADAFRTVGSAAARVDRVLQQLRRVQVADEDSGECDLVGVLREVSAEAGAREPAPRLTVDWTGDGVLVTAPCERLRAVLAHLVRNAQEAAGTDGCVELALSAVDGGARVTVRDDGPGMDDTFLREQLFRPFATTKGNAGMGVGVYEARQLIERIGGTLDVQSRLGEGTCFTAWIPAPAGATVADRQAWALEAGAGHG
ncbi:XrtA/PEP-CTERM system histidine kinase PrsK [Arhodomonas sp. SL1]|uniref:XrtA/PEP-CTERM system histidine kinase PrsK n=1 Tax=Arhodomonas sp. SL1 TaxID=3425691 RepID=UPI003F881C0E